MKDAQYRKGLSIAWFNATNVAAELIASLPDSVKIGMDYKAAITEWRDWLLAGHKEYYTTVIANIGVNYKADETIKKLRTAKSIEELKLIWISLSEDERRDNEILKATNALKKSYEKK